MIDAGETLSVTLKREFSEEALDSLGLPEKDRVEAQEHLNKIFHNGIEV